MLYIGKDMQDRMKLLGLNADEVADRAFLERSDIDAVIKNETALEEMDEFDLSLICSVLHCKPEYFTSTAEREKDLLLVSMNRGADTEKSMNVKAKIQDFMNDFAFVKGVVEDK